jgi:hypothetical protein
MTLFPLKWYTLFIFLSASLVIYNYTLLHWIPGWLSQLNFWATPVALHPEPFQLSPLLHAHRQPELLRYEMVLQTEVRWPNGVEKSVITINGKQVNWLIVYALYDPHRTISWTHY